MRRQRVLGRRPTVTGALPAALALWSLSAMPVQADGIYKSVDAQGHVVYSDRGASANSRKSAIQVDQPNPEEVARIAKEQQLMLVEESRRKQEQARQDTQKSREAQERRLKEVRCDNARDNYYRLREARVLYRRDADGNRVYYNDAEADAKREDARKAMLAACGG